MHLSIYAYLTTYNNNPKVKHLEYFYQFSLYLTLINNKIFCIRCKITFLLTKVNYVA